MYLLCGFFTWTYLDVSGSCSLVAWGLDMPPYKAWFTSFQALFVPIDVLERSMEYLLEVDIRFISHQKIIAFPYSQFRPMLQFRWSATCLH